MGGWSKPIAIGRRVLALVVGASVLASLQLVTAPRPTLAQGVVLPAPPLMYATPDCVPGGGSQTFIIRGRNFQPNVRVQVSVAGNLQESGLGDTSAYGNFTASITVNDVDPNNRNIDLEARIVAGGDVPPPVATMHIYPCSQNGVIVVSPNCGDGAAPSIQIAGSRWGSFGDIVIQLYQGESAVGQSVTVPAQSSFNATLNPGVALAAGVYSVQATQFDGKTTTYGFDAFVVPCPVATITPTCAQTAGAPPGTISIDVTGVSGWLSGTRDGQDEIEVVFDPDNEPQEFIWQLPYGTIGINPGGSFGPLTIQPYARPTGTYTVSVRQESYTDDPADTYVEQDLTFTVTCHQPGAGLKIDPVCGPPAIVGDVPRSYTINLIGTDWPAGKFEATFDPDRLGGADFPPTIVDFTIDQAGDFTYPIQVPYRPPGHYGVLLKADSSAGPFSATASFDVPCAAVAPIITLYPPCGNEANGQPGAYAITVTGSGFVPGPVDLTFDPLGTEAIPPVSALDDGSLTDVVIATGRSPGTYNMTASQSTEQGVFDTTTAPFLVGCTGPQMTITPTRGPRGFVPVVLGVGFPANSVVRLIWSYGITARTPVDVTTDADGSFTKQLPIFQHDFLGTRHLSAATPDNALAYPTVGVDYLVTQGPAELMFFADSTVRGPRPIVWRP